MINASKDQEPTASVTSLSFAKLSVRTTVTCTTNI